MTWREIIEKLTETRLTAMGSIIVGAAEAKESQVMSFPVRLGEVLGSCGIVVWGDDKPTSNSFETIIEYLGITRDALYEDERAASFDKVGEQMDRVLNAGDKCEHGWPIGMSCSECLAESENP